MSDTDIYIGNMRRFGNHADSGFGAFTDVDGADTDPTEVRLVVQSPDGTQAIYVWPTPGVGELTLIKEAAQTGRFYADVELDQAGVWVAELRGTGAVKAAAFAKLVVEPRAVTEAV